VSEFRVEKIKWALEVVLTSGHKMSGNVFLEPVARHHSGPQEIRDLLNEAAEYFPFSVAGQTTLLSKDQVRTATYRSAGNPARPASKMIDVKVILADGNAVTGAVEVEPRSDAHRLLDFLNGMQGRYIALAMDGSTTCLINRRMIAGVQQR
jgi:hypothetical protein